MSFIIKKVRLSIIIIHFNFQCDFVSYTSIPGWKSCCNHARTSLGSEGREELQVAWSQASPASPQYPTTPGT